jgi:hypothetical protein
MNRRIDRTGPSVGHHGAAGANSRLNAAAAFRALLGLMRSSGALTDKKTRRGSSAGGGVARGRGGSNFGVEADEAVEALSSNQEGGGDNNNGKRRPPKGRGREGANPNSSLFVTTMTARDAGRPSVASEPISTTSQPLVWPAAALPGAWQRADAPAYVPSSAFVDRTSVPARLPAFYTPWNPSGGGDAVLPAVQRWGRAASVLPYALPLASTAPRVGAKQYRPFTPLLRPAAGAVSTVSQRLRPRSWVRAAPVRPFVPPVIFAPVIFAKAPIQRVRYRLFTLPSSVAGTGSATPDKLKPQHGPRAATIQPYGSPGTFVAPQTKGSKMRSYTPPHRFDGINPAELQKRGAGEMPLPMSIDTLVSHFRLNVGARRRWHIGVVKTSIPPWKT